MGDFTKIQLLLRTGPVQLSAGLVLSRAADSHHSSNDRGGKGDRS